MVRLRESGPAAFDDEFTCEEPNAEIFRIKTQAAQLNVAYYDRPAANLYVEYTRRNPEYSSWRTSSNSLIADGVTLSAREFSQWDKDQIRSLLIELEEQMEDDGNAPPSTTHPVVANSTVSPIHVDFGIDPEDATCVRVTPTTEKVSFSLWINEGDSAKKAVAAALKEVEQTCDQRRREALTIIGLRIQQSILMNATLNQDQAVANGFTPYIKGDT